MRKVLIGLVLLLCPLPGWAQLVVSGDGIERLCDASASDAQRIRACTHILQMNVGSVPEYRSFIYVNRARAHLHMGEFDNALADVTHAMAEVGRLVIPLTDPSRIAALLARGEIYMKMGQVDLGRTDLSQVISRQSEVIARDSNNPKSLAGPYNGRAWAYHLMGEDAQGLPDVMKSLEIEPKRAEALETRAEIYEKLGRRDEAIADYRASLVLDPTVRESKEGLARLGVAP
jgi:tetratricopeptide (TPR) repeat protein